MARMEWKRASEKDRARNAMRVDYVETLRLVNKVCHEQRIAKSDRQKKDYRRALILQAAIKAGIYRGSIPTGPTIRREDTPESIRREQRKRAHFNRMSRAKTDDEFFKKEDRRWNEGNLGDGASSNPV